MAYSQITAGEIASGKPVTTTWGDKVRQNFDFLKSITDGLAPAYFGLQASAAAADPDHDVTVEAGAARDTTDISTLVLAAAQTKRLDARWATGTGVGGLANAALISSSIVVSFDNASAEIRGTGLFSGAAEGDTLIVAGSTSNDGVHEVTAATADAATLAVAPTTEAAGATITVYIVKAQHAYTLFLADDGSGGVELGFDDSPTAANFLALAGVGSEYRAVAVIITEAAANIYRVIGTRGGTVEAFLASGTATRPAFATLCEAEVYSGGGSAAKGTSSTSAAAGGGGGGHDRRVFNASDLPATVAVTVGAGAVRNTTNNTAGTDGGDSSFGDYIFVTGGIGGPFSGGGGSTPGGAGGAADNGGAFPYSKGGQGGEGNSPGPLAGNPSTEGGGGGGAQGGAGSANRAGGVSRRFGGPGGIGSQTAGFDTDGHFPAGGGGAAVNGSGLTQGGKGGDGLVIVIWW